MSTATRSADWLTLRLEAQRALFTDRSYPLPSFQRKRLNDCCLLLKEDNKLRTSKPTQRIRRRLKVQCLLADVYLSFGSELFTLCALAASITDLATVSHPCIQRKLESWWHSVPHPNGLREVANMICEEYSVATLVTRARRTTGYKPNAKSELAKELPTPPTPPTPPTNIQPIFNNPSNDIGEQPPGMPP